MRWWRVLLLALILTLIPEGASAQDYGVRLASKDGQWLLPVASKLLGSSDQDHLNRNSINSWDISASVGTPVFAAAAGVVTTSGCDLFERGLSPILQGYGCSVQIDHGGGIVSQYAHCLENSLRVQPGQQVDQSSVLCQVGRTGKTDWPHVHFTILKGGGAYPIANVFDIAQMNYCKFCWAKNDPGAPIANGPVGQQSGPSQGDSVGLRMLRQIIALPASTVMPALWVIIVIVIVILWLGNIYVRLIVITAGVTVVVAGVMIILFMPPTVQAQPTGPPGSWEQVYPILQANEGWDCTADGAHTMGGVTQGTFNRWRMMKGLPVGDVCKSLTRDEAKAIYYELFWLASGADKMPAAMGLTVLDHYVNTGKVSHLLAQCGMDVACFNRARIIDYQSMGNCNLYCTAWINRVNKIRKYTGG